MYVKITIKNNDQFSIELDGSTDFCSVIMNSMFDFTGVADRPPKRAAVITMDPTPLKETPPVLKKKLDSSPRSYHSWTAAEEDILRDNWFTLGPQKILDDGMVKGVELSALLSHANKMGLRIKKDI
jgi:hypothetical protein